MNSNSFPWGRLATEETHEGRVVRNGCEGDGDWIMGKLTGPGETGQAGGTSVQSTEAGIKAALVEQPGSKSYQTAVEFAS